MVSVKPGFLRVQKNNQLTGENDKNLLKIAYLPDNS